jgi:hypothetical protein
VAGHLSVLSLSIGSAGPHLATAMQQPGHIKIQHTLKP